MNNNDLQRNYYESNLDKRSMQPVSSEYINRHLNKIIDIAELDPDKSLLEVGSGLGKFTLPMIERGYKPACLDISPMMLDRIKQQAAPFKVNTILSDIAEASNHTDEKFDQAIGFFTLHHMVDLAASFRGLGEVLNPGARAAFCEPRALNPLYYLQIALTPGMSWSAEKGIVNMRKKYVFSAIEQAGLIPKKVVSYGFFPPFIVNRPWGSKLTDKLESKEWLSPMNAFQIFVLEKAG